MTTNANGFNERIFVGPETTFKNPPGSPAAYLLPVANVKFAPTVQRFTSDALDGSAEPNEPVDGKVSLAISYDLECNIDSLGPVLAGLFASETVQGTGSYRDHVFYFDTPDSFFAEQQFTDIDQYLVGKGCRFDKQSFVFDPEGIMKSSVSMQGALTSIAQVPFTVSETDYTVGSALSYLFSSVKYNGTQINDLFQEVKVDIDRQAEGVKTINGSNELTDIITKKVMVKGTLKALFQDESLAQDALNSTAIPLELYCPDVVSGYGLWLTLPTIKLQPTGPTTNGPGGLVTQEFNFDAFGRGSNSKTSAFSAGKAFTTVTITGSSNDAVKIAINGVDFTGTLTAGTRTPAQICTDINAISGFSVVATAFVRNGRVWIETVARGSAATVEVKTVSNSFHTTLGFPLAAYTGADKRSIRAVLTNARATAY